jgi:site-specific DNA recombinase
MAPQAAAIYARISSDRDGDALGVARQIADCRDLAERRGWVVAQEYTDNDQSAYRGKRRPAYIQMMEDLKDGFIDAVIVWHLDRLTRSPAELESFFHAMSAAGDPPMASVAGDYDLSTHDGQFHARIPGQWPRRRATTSPVACNANTQELAEAGKLSGGGTRPFGFEADRLTIRPDEATVIREIAERILAGDSKTSICRDLDARGITTSTGRTWAISSLDRMIRSARIAGLREYKGQIIGPAQWPAIITPEVLARVRAAAAAGAASASRTPRRYLLAGMARCSLCGQRWSHALAPTECAATSVHAQ